ncbi:uncharacterized protein J7T54_008074 [Emericellopsis cladophorae]|uniref:EthD domain-containing protein n=1 Tax=Emericellopsis cladophorae TaxID=2686198 RepID=A0A9P9Y8K2_9HYPO|nr:uncharacterized protein J7T54_008074 [Emericellopsis cladophorae]KAI6784980.1 hypothetical protein J7T54_008074 [Emericellopsis cladophorae]
MSQPQPELQGPPLKPGRYIKISLFLKRRPDVTEEYFHAYWLHNHTNLFLGVKAFKELVRKYNQSHYIKELADMNQEVFVGVPRVDFDGVAEFWVDSMEDWRKLWNDEEFTRVLQGDSDYFTMSPLHATAGYDYLFKDDTN